MSHDDAPEPNRFQVAKDVAWTIALVVGPLLGIAGIIALVIFVGFAFACSTGACL